MSDQQGPTGITQNLINNISLDFTALYEAVKAKHSSVTVSPKNGKIYINVTEFINVTESESISGKNTSLLLNSKAELRAHEPKQYIGNGRTKVFGSSGNNSTPSAPMPTMSSLDDLSSGLNQSGSTGWNSDNSSPAPTDDLPF